MERRVLALLVGSNPLPNYLATATLTPSAVHLLYSTQTEPCKDRLRAALVSALGVTEVREFLVGSATKAGEVERACRRALDGADHLNYTGGTKVMAAQARMTFGIGRAASASYVDEASGCIRFDNDVEVPIDASTLTIALLLQLHGVDVPKPRSAAPGDPTHDDAERIAEIVLEHPDVARELCARIPNPGETIGGAPALRSVKSSPIDLRDLEVPVERLPQATWTEKNLKHWMKFLRGEWLEDWTAKRVGRVGPRLEVMTGVQTNLEGRPFECDILALLGPRPFLLSCTTDDQPRLCKSKMFEAALRARQLGGDLARYALVSLMPQAGVSEVQRDVAAVWDAPARPRVFGIEHLREWAGVGRAEPNLDSLRSWIDQ